MPSLMNCAHQGDGWCLKCVQELLAEKTAPHRRCLPNPRQSIRWHLVIVDNSGQEYSLYVDVGHYENGDPGEMFLVLAKEGTTLRGFADSWAQSFSYNLQWGVPLEKLVRAWRWSRFEPGGEVRNHPDIVRCTSIPDAIMQLLTIEYLMKGKRNVLSTNPARMPEPTAEEIEQARQWLNSTRESEAIAEYKSGLIGAADTDTNSDNSANSNSTNSGNEGAETVIDTPLHQPSAFLQRMHPSGNGTEGNVCSMCHSPNLKRSGSCITCENCGHNSGCG